MRRVCPTTSSRENPHACNHRSCTPVTVAKRKLDDLYMRCDETDGVDAVDDLTLHQSHRSEIDDEIQALTAGHEDGAFGKQCVGARSTSACGTPPSEPSTPPAGDNAPLDVQLQLRSAVRRFNAQLNSGGPSTTCGPLPCSFRAAPPGGAALRADVAFHAAKVRQPPSSQRNAWANLHVLGL